MKFILLSLLTFAFSVNATITTGSANQVMRVPSGGGLPKLGSINLASSAAVGSSVLPIANGGAISLAQEYANCSIAASVSSNALTVGLKDASGSDPSASSPCKISFRNATATTGTYNEVSTTGAVSFTVSNGSALGCTASASCTVYVYGVYTGSAVVLGTIGLSQLDEGTVQSSTAEGGAGAADSAATLYTTSAQTSKPVRLLGRLTITPGASFAWSAGPTEISNIPLRPMTKAMTIQRFTSGSGTYTTPAGVSYIRVTVVGGGGGGAGSGTAAGTASASGGSSTFGSALLTAAGGNGGSFGTIGVPGVGGTGGSATVNSPAVSIVAVSGGAGVIGQNNASESTAIIAGGHGGENPLGGAGASVAGVANTGAGGGGAGGNNTSAWYSGGGGGAGGYIVALISSPSATYSYAVGGAGTAGGAGTGGAAGGAGGSGVIIVEEYY